FRFMSKKDAMLARDLRVQVGPVSWTQLAAALYQWRMLQQISDAPGWLARLLKALALPQIQFFSDDECCVVEDLEEEAQDTEDQQAPEHQEEIEEENTDDSSEQRS
ncbi:MAG: hypothetical protein EB015_22020, partial [Methylocystaceae bacterium]|nr:hypothetical protein [Methylocystaceae bacterium]